jgi:electron transfer flavoprotein beta subunit
MKIAVLVKLVPDTQANLSIAADGKSISMADLNMVLNVYDEFAVEEGLKIKADHGGTVTVITLGEDGSIKALRNALAMGADDAVHIKGISGFDILNTAKILAASLKDKGFDIILAGKQAVDDDCGAIGPMVAELLDISHVSSVNNLEVSADKLVARREIEGGAEVFELDLPALITAEKGLNEPRYASLKGIMMSKKKKVVIEEAEAHTSDLEIISLSHPPVRPPGIIVGDGVDAVPELVRLLKMEAKVI